MNPGNKSLENLERTSSGVHVCRSHVKDAAGACPSPTCLQQEEHFLHISDERGLLRTEPTHQLQISHRLSCCILTWSHSDYFPEILQGDRQEKFWRNICGHLRTAPQQLTIHQMARSATSECRSVVAVYTNIKATSS